MKLLTKDSVLTIESFNSSWSVYTSPYRANVFIPIDYTEICFILCSFHDNLVAILTMN